MCLIPSGRVVDALAIKRVYLSLEITWGLRIAVLISAICLSLAFAVVIWVNILGGGK